MHAFWATKMDLEIVRCELAQLLAAAAARRDDLRSGTDQGTFHDTMLAGGDQSGDGGGLGAKALRISCVLDVAATMDAAVFVAHRSATRKLGIGRMARTIMVRASRSRSSTSVLLLVGTPTALGATARPMKPASRNMVRDRARPGSIATVLSPDAGILTSRLPSRMLDAEADQAGAK